MSNYHQTINTLTRHHLAFPTVDEMREHIESHYDGGDTADQEFLSRAQDLSPVMDNRFLLDSFLTYRTDTHDMECRYLGVTRTLPKPQGEWG